MPLSFFFFFVLVRQIFVDPIFLAIFVRKIVPLMCKFSIFVSLLLLPLSSIAQESDMPGQATPGPGACPECSIAVTSKTGDAGNSTGSVPMAEHSQLAIASTSNSSGTCAKWCASKNAEKKCTNYQDCFGCPECLETVAITASTPSSTSFISSSGGCAKWCASKSAERKCTEFEECFGCAECSPTVVTTPGKLNASAIEMYIQWCISSLLRHVLYCSDIADPLPKQNNALFHLFIFF